MIIYAKEHLIINVIVRVPRDDLDVEGLCLCICPLDPQSLHIWAMAHSVLLSLRISDMDACVHVVCEMGMEINATFPAKRTNINFVHVFSI